MHDGENKLSKRMDARFTWLIILIIVPVYLIFIYLDEENRGFIVVSILSVFCVVAYIRKDIISKRYFILTIMPFLIVEISAAMLLRLPKYDGPGIFILPAVIFNVVALLYLLMFIGRKFDPAPSDDGDVR